MSQAANPFTGGGAPPMAIPVPGLIRDWGFRLQESMIAAARAVTDEGRLGALAAALGIAFLFGVVHIIGPGHGKLFTIGYFGSRRARLREGLALSALVNTLDSLSAFLLVGVVYGVLSLSLRGTGMAAQRVTRLVAYGAISLLGVGHLIGHLRHRHDDGHREMKGWMLALSVGIIPCPVSSAILAWGLVNGALGFAVVLVAGVSLGGMAAMSVFSLALIYGKSRFVAVMEGRGFHRALGVFEIASMGFLSLVGVVLFLTAL